MEYVFGTVIRNNIEFENLKVINDSHTDLRGFIETVREFEDNKIIDKFQIIEKYYSTEDICGNTYDWYIIDKHYRYEDKASFVAQEIKSINEITFISLAENGFIDTVTAGEHIDIFLPWELQASYQIGTLRQYNNKLYKCINSHTSQEGWEPDKAISLWVEIYDSKRMARMVCFYRIA